MNFKRGNDIEKKFILHELDKLLEKAQYLEKHFGYRAVLISLIASLLLETGDYYESEKYLTKLYTSKRFTQDISPMILRYLCVSVLHSFNVQSFLWI